MATYITEDGNVYYENVPEEKRALFPNLTEGVPYEDLYTAVSEWLEDHPEATTTVEDGSITPVKLDSDNEAEADYVLGYDGEKFVWVDVNSMIASTYARIDGSYDNMTVGNAKQLVSTVFVEDEVPYLFRTSGGSADIGDREYDKIVGGTIAWNQLANGKDSYTQNGITSTFTSGTGVYELSGEASASYASSINSIYPVTGHKYFQNLNVIANPNNKSFGCGSLNGRIYKVETTNTSGIFVGTDGTESVTMGVQNFTSGDDVTGIKFQYILIDLTQMFGSTIADYIYTLETANAGAGVAWFRKLFPKSYYAYDAGTLKSVENLDSHDMTGFNQWDEEWRNGYYGPSGAFVENSSNLANKNPIKVVSNTTYRFRSGEDNPFNVYFFDGGDNLLSFSSVTNNTFTTPANAVYINFCTGSTAYGGSYKHDICINISWDGERDGEYEPYELNSYPLDDSLTLRGIPKLDANNTLYYDGDTYEADGTVTRRYGVVDLGTLTWNVSNHATLGDYFYANVSSLGIHYGRHGWAINEMGVCSKYTFTTRTTETFADKTICYDGNESAVTQLDIKDSAYNDAIAFKTAMSGVYLVYELATPTTEEAEPFQNPQIVNDFGTEEYVTDSIVPVGHYTKYNNNLRAKLETLPESPSGNGDYVLRQTSGVNSWVLLTIPEELPDAPTEDGTYTLTVTVSSGEATYAWVSTT